MRFRPFLLAAALLLSALAPLRAQTPTVHPGDEIRLAVRGDAPIVGVATAVSADSISVRPQGWSAPYAIPRATLSRLEVRTGTVRPQASRGVFLGAGLGALLGFFAVSYGGSGNQQTGRELTGSAFEAAAAFGAGGALLGGLLAASERKPIWTEVPVRD